jgi:hypothetical protein
VQWHRAGFRRYWALEIAPTGRATADSGHTVGLASHSIPVRVYGKLRGKTVAI